MYSSKGDRKTDFIFINSGLPMQTPFQASDEAAARKMRSIARLEAEGVPTIDHLPVIDREDKSIRRSKEEIVQRAIALLIVAIKAEASDYELGQSAIKRFKAENFFTPKERAFLQARTTVEQDRIGFVWRYEDVHVMLWALGIASKLGRPDSICDVSFLASTISELGHEGLVLGANLRSQAELLDEADLIYRYHWAMVNARLKRLEAPAGLEPSVVYERHYALNWLIGHMNQDWDDISTDT